MNHLSKQMQFVNDAFNEAREIGIIHVPVQKDEVDSRLLYLDGKPTLNFVSNNFLGFESDPRVKQAAVEAVNKYGIFSSITRAYVSFEHYLELEEKFEKIFGLPAYMANNTTLGHFSYLPIIVGKHDAIIIDQFAHNSIQMVVQYLKGGGIYAETIRHNQTEELEKRIKILSEQYDKVWYLTDGVFSMHGDTTPYKDLEVLLNAYDKFHLYVDDAHGMSWIGENGKGCCLHNMVKHEKLYLICSLNKGFGASNAVMVFPDKETKRLVSNCGNPLVFCTPTLHAGIGAASKIADIHLTDEIYEKQMILNERIKYFKQLSKQHNLPIIDYTHTPLFFLGLGSLENVYRFGKHFIDEGFILSAASVPSVPLKQSGLRISLTAHQKLEDIKNLVECAANYINDLENKGLFNREEALKGFRIKNQHRAQELVLA